MTNSFIQRALSTTLLKATVNLEKDLSGVGAKVLAAVKKMSQHVKILHAQCDVQDGEVSGMLVIQPNSDSEVGDKNIYSVVEIAAIADFMKTVTSVNDSICELHLDIDAGKKQEMYIEFFYEQDN